MIFRQLPSKTILDIVLVRMMTFDKVLNCNVAFRRRNHDDLYALSGLYDNIYKVCSEHQMESAGHEGCCAGMKRQRN